jgi:palmitoyl-protein thioesterase
MAMHWLPWSSTVAVLLLVLCMQARVHAGRVADLSLFKPLESNVQALPVVLWHGMGDSCCSMASVGSLKKLIEDKLGVFVHSIATGDGEYADIWSSFYGNVNQQVDKVCDELSDMKELAGGFNMVGFSQGGQFLRAVVERCGHKLPPVHTLITLGGQHQGVANTPGCEEDLTGVAAKACTAMQVMLARGAYAPWVRENLVQAQYFKDPYNLDAYLANNIFLPDINNERLNKNQLYADNMASLERLVLVMFEEDTTVVPRESAWFGFWDGKSLIPLQDQALFTDDWLGLKKLHDAGNLLFDSAPGEHMQFTLSWFNDNIVQKYLAGTKPQPEPQPEPQPSN